MFNNKLSILILLFLITSLSGYHTAYAGGAIGGSSCPTDIAFRERPVGQRQLSREELKDIRTMNDSIFCKRNCMRVAERVAKYFNTGKRELIKLPPLENLQNGDEDFTLTRPAEYSRAAFYSRLESEAVARGILLFRPRTTDVDALVADLVNEGPGTHAVVSGAYAPAYTSPSFSGSHVFNLIVVDGANGPEVMVIDGSTSVARYTTTATGEFKGAFTVYNRTFQSSTEWMREVFRKPFIKALAFSPPPP